MCETTQAAQAAAGRARSTLRTDCLTNPAPGAAKPSAADEKKAGEADNLEVGQGGREGCTRCHRALIPLVNTRTPTRFSCRPLGHADNPAPVSHADVAAACVAAAVVATRGAAAASGPCHDAQQCGACLFVAPCLFGPGEAHLCMHAAAQRTQRLDQGAARRPSSQQTGQRAPVRTCTAPGCRMRRRCSRDAGGVNSTRISQTGNMRHAHSCTQGQVQGVGVGCL